MHIEFLKDLEELQKDQEPISIEEINDLEVKYNSGVEFPKALRELLILAGGHCNVLEYGLAKFQDEIQKNVRNWLLEENQKISRPFYAIDTYNSPDGFLFVYLDEQNSDPMVFVADIVEANGGEVVTWSTEKSLSEFLTFRVNRRKRGLNPF